MMIIFYFILPVVLLFFVFKWLMKKWKAAEVEQRIEDVKDTSELVEKTKEIDVEEARKQKKNLNDFMEETQ